mmetsp:Transcript_4747/g.5710  ORF Transcript_4747/g.5710 Transcript_4747/m.5710 type:complete len:92 (-) Transcript_4747:107-382(-)
MSVSRRMWKIIFLRKYFLWCTYQPQSQYRESKPAYELYCQDQGAFQKKTSPPKKLNKNMRSAQNMKTQLRDKYSTHGIANDILGTILRLPH